MMYLRWFFFAIISFNFNLLIWVTSPVWGLFAALWQQDSLPFPFNYVHTHDAPVWGDGSDDDQRGMPKTFWRRWWVATTWIARNPGYTFDAKVLGFSDHDIDPDSVTYTDRGEMLPGSNPPAPWDWDTGHRRTLWWSVCTYPRKEFFAYRRDFPIAGKLYIKLWLGWNYKNLAGYHPIKVSIGPKFVKD